MNDQHTETLSKNRRDMGKRVTEYPDFYHNFLIYTIVNIPNLVTNLVSHVSYL